MGVGQGSLSIACTLLYESGNLAGHDVSAECYTTTCTPPPECDDSDVAIIPEAGYGIVVSNVNLEPGLHVNAVGHKTFIEVFPNGAPITLQIYKYTGMFRLPRLPDKNSSYNPENVQMMIQLYDGSNTLWTADKQTLEATIYWTLNPWTAEGESGQIKIYTDSSSLPIQIDGMAILPDTSWHSFELIVDLAQKKYESITIDGTKKDLSAYGLYQRQHSDWGDELALSITTETEATYPGNCETFSWETEFKDLDFWDFDDCSYLLWTQ